MDFPLNFLVDFLFTLLLFSACFIAVSGVKLLLFRVKKRLKKFFPEKYREPRKKPKRKSPAAIRSIEINPEEVDRIYVKKIS